MITVYVGNIPFSVKEKDLKKEFSNYGKVSSVSLIKNWTKDQSRGFAFVNMEEEQDALDAVEDLDGSQYGDCILQVEISKRSRYLPFKERKESLNDNEDLTFSPKSRLEKKKFGFNKK